MDEPAICAEGLGYRFRGSAADALADVSFRIMKGNIVGLAGPDGSGKTTLIRLLAGLLKPTRGQVQILSLSPLAQGDALRPRLGYLPQKFGLYEDLSVQENLTLYARLRGISPAQKEEQFKRLLAFTGLGPFTQRQAGKLSGGMKQKLGLACTLLGAPEILLLDEPSVGVDPLSRRELWEMVHSLATRGMSILWATSYLEEASRCGEILLMERGRVIFHGQPESAIAGVQGRVYALGGIDKNRRNILREVWKDGNVMDAIIQGSNVRVLMRPGKQPPSPEQLGAGGLARWRCVIPTLENAFIDLLGGIPKQTISDIAYGGVQRALSANSSNQPGIGQEISGAVISSSIAVEAEGLTRMFGSFTAANDICFQAGKGTIFGLLGPNGAGKSTTFKMLCGLLAPSYGTARIEGSDIRRQGACARQKIGYMSQKFSLYGHLSVSQNLEFFAGIYGLHGEFAKKGLQRAVQDYGLKDFLETNAGSLPLGFKQRLALACATLHNPSVLFLDEPTSGVDPIARREFWMRINGFVTSGITVIVTTHFMEEAEYCDALVLIDRGRIIARGTPDEIKQQGRTPADPDPSMETAFIHLIERQEHGGIV